ncbi:hypothetical protein CR513_19080, partial [Mucuna pruriens]
MDQSLGDTDRAFLRNLIVGGLINPNLIKYVDNIIKHSREHGEHREYCTSRFHDKGKIEDITRRSVEEIEPPPRPRGPNDGLALCTILNPNSYQVSKMLMEGKRGKRKSGGGKSKRASERKETLLVGRKEVKRMLLARKEPILLFPTNMFFYVTYPLLNLLIGFQDMLEEYKGIFPKEMLQGLPPLRGIEHHIDLIFGASLLNRHPDTANPKVSKEIQKQVEKLLEKGWKRESISPCAILVILVPKKDDTWRMVREGDEWKATFMTKFGLYEWLIMPLALINALSTFMRLMNHVLRSLIGKCVVVYYDDILVYSSCVDDYVMHVKREKFTFCIREVLFLGFVVVSHGVKVDDEKVKANQNWPIPQSVHDWEKSQERAFQALKDSLTHAPILTLLKFSKSFELECNASNMGKFVVHSDHESLKHLRAQNKLNKRHVKWVEILEQFPYIIKHKQGKVNIVADALSRRHLCLRPSCLGLNALRNYTFGMMTYELCANLANGGLFRHEGSSIRELLVREAYESGLIGHFRELKTFETLNEHSY